MSNIQNLAKLWLSECWGDSNVGKRRTVVSSESFIQIRRMYVAGLDKVMFEIVVRAIRHTPHIFSDKVDMVAERTRGVKSFEVRVDGDRHIQRIAGVAYQSEGLGLLALDRLGDGLIAQFVDESFEIFTTPLVHWSSLSLPEQAVSEFQGATLLLIAAIRSRGYPLA